ncbi:hydrophilic protein virA protein, partial [Vibrio cholerae]|nr:hydrophilic protein virA protein [Vibrio cholerae]
NEIEATLIKDNISTGSKPESDISKVSWKYLSYRNENRSDRDGGSAQEVRLKNEPFFQCI